MLKDLRKVMEREKLSLLKFSAKAFGLDNICKI